MLANIPGSAVVLVYRTEPLRKAPIMQLTPLLPLSAALLAVLAVGQARAADTPTPRICIISQDIQSTHAVDDSTILFTMLDGKVWKNTLRAPCHELKFRDNFTYEDFGGQICANDQKIRVLEPASANSASLRASQLGPFCQLGDFTLQSKPQ
jgi:hypothetical protein